MPVVGDIAVGRGEDITLHVKMDPVKDITGWVISFTIAKAFNVLPKLIQVTAIATNAPAGEYDIILTSTQLNINPDKYAYDIFRVNPGNLRLLRFGNFIIMPDAKFPQ